MADKNNSSDKLKKNNCNYCKKNMVSGVHCVKCKNTYHNSCGDRLKNCCDLLLEKQSTEDKNPMVSIEMFHNEENALLKQIIKDKETIIMDKEALITLLNEKIQYLEKSLKGTHGEEKQSKHQQNKGNKNTKIMIPAKSDQNNQITSKSADTLQEQNNDHSLNELENYQMNVMTQLINMNNDTISENKIVKDNEKNFQLVSHKKRKQRRVYFGEAEGMADGESTGFVGRDRKNWLFISRAKDHVTEDIVKKYLESKGDKEAYVKEIDAYKKTKDNRRFKIGLSYDYKDAALQGSFWPKGVAVYRFDFRKEQKYLSRLNNAEGGERPENFQVDHYSQQTLT